MAQQNLKVNITGDSTKLNNALSSASSKISAFGSKMQSVGKTLSTRLTLPLVAAGGAAIKFASDFEESMNKVDVAFGNSKKEVKDFAKTTLKEFGIAEGSALDMAALFGDMATSMGLTTDKAAGMSTQLVGLAGDLASFKNINISEAQTALAGVFTGETESLKRLGIVMTQVNLEQFAMSKGISTSIKNMSQAQKVALRYEYIMSKTANAQGDFARTGGGAANQMRIFQESLKELAAKFGQLILPTFTKIVSFTNDLIQGFTNLSPSVKKIIVIFGGIAAALGPVLAIIGTLMTMAPAISAAFTVMTGPIGLVVAALTAVSVVIYKNWAGIKTALIKVGNYFIELYNNSLPIKIAVDAIILTFKTFLAVGKFVINSIITIWKNAGKAAMSIFGSIGDIIMGVFTLDIDQIKKGFSGIGDAMKTAFVDNVEGIKNEAKVLGETAVDNFNDALNSKKIAPIKTPVSFEGSGAGATTSTSGALGASDGGNGQRSNIKTLIESTGIESTGVSFTPITDMIKADTALIPTAMDEQAVVLSEKRLEAMDNAMQFNQGLNSIITGGLNELAGGIGQALGKALSEGGNLAQSLSKVVLTTIGNMASQLGKLAISIGVGVGAIKKSLQSLNPAVAIAAGIALVALGSFASSKAAKIGGGAGATAFANGGIVSGPTMGLVGEYPGARANPEVIAPLNKLQNIIGNTGGSQHISVGGEIRLEGQDLLIAIERANETSGRIY